MSEFEYYEKGDVEVPNLIWSLPMTLGVMGITYGCFSGIPVVGDMLNKAEGFAVLWCLLLVTALGVIGMGGVITSFILLIPAWEDLHLETEAYKYDFKTRLVLFEEYNRIYISKVNRQGETELCVWKFDQGDIAERDACHEKAVVWRADYYERMQPRKERG